MAMLLKHPRTHDVRAIEGDLNPCCQLAVWNVLVEELGYKPYDPNARVYAARLQTVVNKEHRA